MVWHLPGYKVDVKVDFRLIVGSYSSTAARAVIKLVVWDCYLVHDTRIRRILLTIAADWLVFVCSGFLQLTRSGKTTDECCDDNQNATKPSDKGALHGYFVLLKLDSFIKM